MQETEDRLVMPRRVYFLIGISLLFGFLTFAAGLVIFATFFDLLSPEFTDYLLCSPFIFCFVGILFGFLAKETAQRYLVISNQGCLAEASIYLNLTSLGLLILFYVLYLIYLAPLSD